MRGDIPSVNPSKMGSWELIKYVLLSVIIVFGLASIIATGGGGGGGGGGITPGGGASGGIFPSDEITVAEDPAISVIQDVYGNDIEIAGQQIVAVFTDGATSQNYYELEAFLKNRNAKIVGQIPPLRICQIEASNLADVMNLVIQLAQLPYISDAFPNRVYSLARETDPSSMPGNWWTEKIQLEKAWDFLGDQDQIGNPDIKIGIVDSGVSGTWFDDLNIGGASKPRLNALNPDEYDVHDHGTQVAAIAAADRNDLHFSMVGVAPDSPVVSWDSKTRNSDLHDITQIKAGIAACIIEGKAKVVNVSIATGSTENIKKAKDLRWQLRWSIWLAAQPEYEALLILASGNLESQEDNDLFPDHDERGEIDPELKEYWKEVYEKNAIIVTGTNKDNKVIYHYGDIIDLAAPAQGMTKAYADGSIDDVGLGTSFAAPQVTGAAALIWSANPNLNPCEVKRILTDTGRRIEETESGADIRKYNIRILDLYNALTHTELTSPGPLTATIISPSENLTIYEGESVYFDVSVKGETCSSEYEYFWTFGVGIPDYYGLVPGNVTFSTAGTYNVFFAVTNTSDPWDYDYDSVRVTVNEIPYEEFRVNTYTSNNQEDPSVAGVSGGGFVVTWESMGQDGSGSGIYGQRFDSSGNEVGGEFPVNTYTSGGQGQPSVAALSNGGFVVTWTSFDEQDGSGAGVYGQRYDSSGNRVGTEFQVNTYTSGWQSDPSVAGLSNGGFVVTWGSSGQDGSEYGIFGQRYDSSGNEVGGEFQVNITTDNSQNSPSVAGLSGGGFVVTWESFGQDGSGCGIYGRRF